MAHLSKVKRKRAVRKIENAWIKYHPVFFARKKLPWLRVVQKYIKSRKDQIVIDQKIKSVKKARELLKGIGIANMLAKKINSYK